MQAAILNFSKVSEIHLYYQKALKLKSNLFVCQTFEFVSLGQILCMKA